MSLSGLRTAASRMGGAKSKGKGGYYAKWTPPSLTKDIGRLTPSEVHQYAEPIVFVEGEYPDHFDNDTLQAAYHHRFHRYIHHHQGGQSYRTITCLSGPDAHAQKPCIGCLKIDQKEWDEKAYGARSAWVFNVGHLVSYHEMPYVKQGQIQYRDNDPSKPIMITRQCNNSTIANNLYWGPKGRNKPCEGCQQGAPVKLGGHRYIEVGKNHLYNILDFADNTLKKVCVNCNTGLVETGFYCKHCKNVVLDIATSGFTNDQLKDFQESNLQCRHCGQNDVPVPIYDCGYDSKGISKVSQECGNSAPLTLFDVVLWIQREGEGTQSAISIPKWCRLTEAPFGENQSATDISNHVKSIVPSVFDFEDLFGTTTADQAKALNCPDPYGPQGQQQNFHSYAQPMSSPTVAPIAPSVPPPSPPQPGYAPPTSVPRQQAVPTVPAMPPAPPLPMAAPQMAPPQFTQPPAQPAQPAMQPYPQPPVTGGRPPWSNT
jgi:hypothetical protein